MPVRLPLPRSDVGKWGALLNKFLRVSHNDDGTLKTSSLADLGLGSDDISNWDAAYDHISATGASHSYINQDVTTIANVTLAGLTIKNPSGDVIFHVDDDELYFTALPEIAAGNPFGVWLFWFTYAA